MEQYKHLRAENVSFNNQVKTLISTLRFGCIGNVSNVYEGGKRVDITLPYKDVNEQEVVLKGVELLRPGTHKVKINYEPEKGDLVLAFAMQDLYLEGKFSTQTASWEDCPYFNSYGDITLKAIPVQTNEDNDSALNITIKDEEVEVKCANNQKVSIIAKSVNINNGHFTVDENG